jgi:DNA-binding CsgD family transcriptional regulator
MDGVIGAARAMLDQGLGVYGYLYDASNPDHHKTQPIRFHGCSPRLQIFARETVAATTPEVVRTLLLRHTAGVTSELLGDANWTAFLDQFEGGPPFRDTVAINAVDPTGMGCVLVGPAPRQVRMTARSRTLWSQVGAHFASAYRLRRSLAAQGKSPLESAEAIIDANGAIQHATGESTSQSARETLRRTALQIDRACGPKGGSPEDALSLWTALVAGRWSVVDHFDTDGRRFFVAWRNDLAVPAHRRLTERELQVALYAALGHPNKLIAYELGVGPSAISMHLHAAQKKLGLRTRAALMDIVRSLVPPLPANARSAS